MLTVWQFGCESVDGDVIGIDAQRNFIAAFYPHISMMERRLTFYRYFFRILLFVIGRNGEHVPIAL